MTLTLTILGLIWIIGLVSLVVVWRQHKRWKRDEFLIFPQLNAQGQKLLRKKMKYLQIAKWILLAVVISILIIMVVVSGINYQKNS